MWYLLFSQQVVDNLLTVLICGDKNRILHPERERKEDVCGLDVLLKNRKEDGTLSNKERSRWTDGNEKLNIERR